MAASYEQKVLAWLHTMQIEHDPEIGSGKRHIVVEEVRLTVEGPEVCDSVVILFREVCRPQGLFGFLTLARESYTAFQCRGKSLILYHVLTSPFVR
jgi:hypothetical protein